MKNAAKMGKIFVGIVALCWVASSLHAQEYHCSTAPPGVEVRYFLASNFMVPASIRNPMQRWNEPGLDLDRHAWYQSDPDLDAAYGTINRDGEWEVAHFGSSCSTTLTLHQGGINSPLSRWQGGAADTNLETGKPGIAMLHCDLIYRLPENQLGLKGALYVLSDSVFDYSGRAIAVHDDTLSYDKYQKYVSAPPPEENRLVLDYPRGSRWSHYAVERLTVSVDSLDPQYHGDPPANVTITVRALSGMAEIYIRGFRLRSNWMENLIEGKQNTRLTNDFRGLLASKTPDERSLAIQDLQSITTGCGELPVSGFRAVAFIDNLLYHFGIQYDHREHHIEQYLPESIQNVFTTDWYRSVYEDETLRLPPSRAE